MGGFGVLGVNEGVDAVDQGAPPRSMVGRGWCGGLDRTRPGGFALFAGRERPRHVPLVVRMAFPGLWLVFSCFTVIYQRCSITPRPCRWERERRNFRWRPRTVTG